MASARNQPDADLPGASLSAAARVARLHDPDRFLVALFGPPARREALFVLIAFNHELARALERPSARGDAGPIAAMIRLQWWREVVEGETRRHELACALQALIRQGLADRRTLLSIIDAREEEAACIDSLSQWETLQLAGAGGMQVALAEALGLGDPAMLQAARLTGAAYAAGAIVRHHRAILKAGRCPLPDDLLFASGSSREALLASEQPEPGAGVLDRLRGVGQSWLAQTQWPPLERSGIAAALPLVLARRDLAGRGAGARGIGDRLALTLAWLRGKP